MPYYPPTNSGSGAPTDATYITQTANGSLGAEQALSTLSSGIMRVATATGVVTSLGDTLPATNGGTGVSNAGTLTNASNTTVTGGGTIALGGFTLNVPATGSAALLATANTFTAAQAIAINDVGTNTTTTLATLTHNSSGTPAASFGSRLLFNLDSATVDDRSAAAIDVIWTTATDATRTSAILLSTVAAAGALTERLRIAGDGNLTLTTTTNAGLNLTATGSTKLHLGQIGAEDWQFRVNWALASNTQDDTAKTGWAFRLGASSNDFAIYYYPANDASNITQLCSIAATQTATRIIDAVTNSATVGKLFDHTSTGTPAAGFGVTARTALKSSTTAAQTAHDVTTTWVVATHASRTARVVHNVYDTAAREALRVEASGSAAMIGFLGASAVVRQTGGENLTNNVTSGGTDGTIANFTDLTIYTNDAAAIRNNIYQLARSEKQIRDALRLYGLLT